MDDDVLVLWDIDGTLLNADGVGRDLYHEVFAELFGRPLEACAPMAGRTDRAIILQTLTMAGVEEPRRYVDPFLAGLGAHAQAVGSAVTEHGQALPGAVEALAALAAASGTAASVPIITYTTQAANVSAAAMTVLDLPAPSAAVPATAAVTAAPAAAAATAPAAAVLVSAAGGATVNAVGAGTTGTAVAVADGPGPESDISHQAARGAGAISLKSAPTGSVAIEPSATGAAVANHPSPAAVAIEPTATGAAVANVPPPAAVAIDPTAVGGAAGGAAASSSGGGVATIERTANVATTVTSAPAPVAVGTAGVSLTGATPGGGTGTHADGRQRRLHQSVLTGNIRLLAEVKLAALGLRNGLDLCIGAYGDDHEDRAELIQVARRRAAAVHGRSANAFAGAATVVIGDTPGDVAAALAAGARAIAVASGAHSATELHSAGAYAVLRDLTDTELVLEALLG
jgi:phosphoglycolate phosphatase-like HAD superfamily hydrolase